MHISSGISALAALTLLGKRKGYPKERFMPHNLPMTILGAGLLWFGWFGFNAEARLPVTVLPPALHRNTHCRWNRRSNLDVRGMDTLRKTNHSGNSFGSGCRSRGDNSGMRICWTCFGNDHWCRGRFVLLSGNSFQSQTQYDDSLDVVGIHGVGGTWGALATGLFATVAVNADAANGLFSKPRPVMDTNCFGSSHMGIRVRNDDHLVQNFRLDLWRSPA